MSTDTSTTDTGSGDQAADDALNAMLNGGDEDTDTTTGDADDTADGHEDGEDSLGDAGKQALDRMKAKLKAERERRIAAEEKAAKALGEDDAARIEREALAKANARIVRAEIKAAAAGKLADPADALTFLSADDFEVDDDGDVDAGEIAAAIDDLVRRKPYLAAQGGSARPRPDRSQGATGKAATSTDQLFANALKGAL